MSDPYRESATTSIACPRCGDTLAGPEILGCPRDCGVWVPAALTSIMDATELAPSRLTSWFRELAACPMCGVQMTLRGHDMSRFLGCDEHGYWLDAAIVSQTSLGRPGNATRLAQTRAATEYIARGRALAEELEQRTAAERALHERELEAQRITRARAELEARREAAARRIAAERDAKRQRYAALVREAVARPDALVDELMRIDDTLAALRERLDRIEGISSPQS